MRRVLALALLFSIAWGAEPRPLRVMSFNIRYDTPLDVEGRSWLQRRGQVARVVTRFAPDLVGFQEVLAHQRAFLEERLEGYASYGVGRDDGQERGEQSPLFWRKDRFELLEKGTLWLSPEPGRAGSRGWDAALPRIASWVRLRDREGRTLTWLNTHWDHVGKVARLESAKVLKARLARVPAGDLVVVTGDFNAREGDEPHAAMLEKLRDAHREANPERREDEASYHAWSGKTAGRRIDWILHAPPITASEARIVRSNEDGRWPSDHFPVTAVLALTAR